MSLALKRKAFKFYKCIICDSLSGIKLSSPYEHIPPLTNWIRVPLHKSKGSLRSVSHTCSFTQWWPSQQRYWEVSDKLKEMWKCGWRANTLSDLSLHSQTANTTRHFCVCCLSVYYITAVLMCVPVCVCVFVCLCVRVWDF